MPPPHPKAIGRYAIVEPLGQGGMGVVYRAWDPDLRRMVALKVISGSREEPVNDEVFERFTREAQSAASLTHPNIVTVHDFGRDAGRHPFIVMELVDGQSMAQMIREARSLPLGRRVRMMAELCEGLAYAHARGVIHRDVKPANLMITSAGILKILDFGLARLTGDLVDSALTQVGAVIGTPRYMSPEQISGRPADARSDVYAVGTVMYELFTGHVAPGGLAANFGRPLMGVGLPPISEAVPGFPADLAAMVTRATERAPADRYQHLEQLAGELRAWEREFGGPDSAARPAGHDVHGSESVETVVSGLDGILGQWENAVGRALAAPAEKTVSDPSKAPDGRGPHPVPPHQPASQPAALSRRAIAAVAILAMLAVAGLYLATHLELVAAWRSIAAPEKAGSLPVTEGQTAPDTDQGGSRRPDRRQSGSAASGEAPAPGPGNSDPTTQSEVAARCTAILERAGIGEELTTADRAFLAERCRNRSR